MLIDILKNNKCFKLVCGAGNEKTAEVERLVYTYSKAGCSLFDVSANVDIIKAAKKGLLKAGISKDRYICVSFGIKGDPHINKARINTLQCKNCGQCKSICPQNAIFQDKQGTQVKQSYCIGCAKCIELCNYNAISLIPKIQDTDKILMQIASEHIDCIEFHATVDNEEDVMHNWQILNSLYHGILSICIDRSNLSNNRMIKRIKNMLKMREPYTTIIQADGIPISGGENDYKTTLQAIATAELIQNEKLPAYMLISGGTNSKTAKLAHLCGIYPNGIAVGSYARKIVKNYINREDFYINPDVQNDAIMAAQELVSMCT